MTEMNGNTNMRNFKEYINEWKLTNDSDVEIRMIIPKSYEELEDIINNRLKINPEILNLTDINIKNIYDFNSKNYTNSFNGLFASRNIIKLIDLTGWDMSHVNCTAQMFWGCTNLETIKGIENWDMSHVEYTWNMFEGCKSLKSLNIENWKLENIIKMTDMFAGCDKSIIPSWYKNRIF